jgi:diaminopimelate decarboxylase
MLLSEKDGFAYRIADEVFSVSGADLLIGGIPVRELAATYGTPLFIYDASTMRQAYRSLKEAVAGFSEVFFSVKANPNPAILRVFLEEGAGLEIASGNEYLRAISAGADRDNIYFAGPGKGEDELECVIGGGIGEIHLESYEEINRVAALGKRLGRSVRVAIRINPAASAQGGAMRMGGKPAPFGFDEEELEAVIDAIHHWTNLHFVGIHLFTGTQILDAVTLVSQWAHALKLARRAADYAGSPISSIDLGGGLGIPYFPGESWLDLKRLKDQSVALAEIVRSDDRLRNARIVIEPGRFLAGPAGIYVVGVRATKVSRGSRFLITDGGMHHHLAASGNLGQIVKRDYPIVAPTRMDAAKTAPCSVVGPLCTPLDTLARQIELPDLQVGDIVGVLQSGAYGLTASPIEFLSHPVPPEVLVEDGKASLIRQRRSVTSPEAGW